MATIEKEIQEALHPVPKTGSVGHEQLDFYISYAENQIAAAKQEIERTEPGPYAADKANAIETMRQYARRARYQVDAQLQSVDQSISLTLASGDRGFRSYNHRPQNITEEQLGRRWVSYKELLDSLSGGAVVSRIREELGYASQIMGGDALSIFLLRDGEGLLIRYLESRKLPLDAYYVAVSDTAQIYETDLKEGVATLLLGRRLAAAWPRIRASLQAQVSALEGLITEKASSWVAKPASGVKVQSEQDGSITCNFGSLEEFRRWARSH